METNSRIIAEYPKCRDCGSTEKVSEKACAELKAKGKIDKDAFTRLKTEITPLEEPRLANIMVEVIMISSDVCFKCGQWRVTRVELIKAPVSGQMPTPGSRR